MTCLFVVLVWTDGSGFELLLLLTFQCLKEIESSVLIISGLLRKNRALVMFVCLVQNRETVATYTVQ